ncbi:PREDICTED: thioredoxin domain-containing protein 2-like [Elephantulus edwardii]|uniref:thioredoxin domain-containing protein 2-like n=1 Tax=Elephantulus edwardii TaxID=28737 RepID=UPI0003F06713|nr:PREDICTED: thioredoxin domain-containing protein 2-like [Elephantulus edwardii]
MVFVTKVTKVPETPEVLQFTPETVTEKPTDIAWPKERVARGFWEKIIKPVEGDILEPSEQTLKPLEGDTLKPSEQTTRDLGGDMLKLSEQTTETLGGDTLISSEQTLRPLEGDTLKPSGQTTEDLGGDISLSSGQTTEPLEVDILKPSEEKTEPLEREKVKAIQSKEDFEAVLKEAGEKLVVVDFSATWCGPCKIIKPLFYTLSYKYDDVVFLEVDADECEDLIKDCGIMSIPTFQFYRKEEKVGEFCGALREKLEAVITELK